MLENKLGYFVAKNSSDRSFEVKSWTIQAVSQGVYGRPHITGLVEFFVPHQRSRSHPSYVSREYQAEVPLTAKK